MNSLNSVHVSAVTGLQASGIQDGALPHPQAPTPPQAFSPPSACPRQIALAGEARSSPLCLLGQGQASRPGQEAEHLLLHGGWEPHSRRTPWHPALLEELVSGAWLPALRAGGSWGLRGIDLICVSWSLLSF